MDPETTRKIEELQASIKGLSERLVPGMPKEEWENLKAAVAEQSGQIEDLLAVAEEKRQSEELAGIKANVDELMRRDSRKDALDGDKPVPNGLEVVDGGPSYMKAFTGQDDYVVKAGWLKALYIAKTSGDPEAWAALRATGLKATLGDSSAAGQYIIPNNFVAQVVQIAKARNIYRGLLDVIDGVRGKAVDLPYEVDDSSLQKAIGQGGGTLSFGSNKDERNFTLASATATLFTVARIMDVGNQFLRQSEGAAERLVRSKLARSFALAEADYILNGPGTGSQPKGIITSIAAASATYSTAYSTGVRADKLAEAIGVLESRNYFPTAIVTNPADFWQIVTDTQGSSGSGGYAVSPAGGASFDPGEPSSALRIWGVPVLRDPNMPVGTAIMGEWSAAQLFIGDEYRVDVSTEADTRWARNITGFRAEEEIAFNADPYVLTGMFQRVTGL